ncbi:hypothetical protein [Haloplanus rubicundus]|uniref:Uncharacterized protein n=1 Tax=Haloplanus rubicundus TaxID=1547898 RepID=A0A345EBB8_9EURY|nr:hypothetical protein [Haloplanus rubicundus]AXG09490.1 hypothetical protein DU484_06190 [Haloplanus rubicundus]
MDPMTPPEFEHSAASEVFEDYDQYLDHHRAKSEGRTASAASLVSYNFDLQTGIMIAFVIGAVLVAAFEDGDAFETFR